jgi:hypothetical protein
MEAAAPPPGHQPPAAPPQAAGVPTRPFDVGRVISETFSTYGRHAGVLLGSAVVIFGVIGIINAFLYDEGGILFNLIIQILNLLGSAIYTGMVVKVVQAERQGTSTSVGEMFESVTHVLGALIGNSILKAIAVGIGFLLLIIPGVFLATIWAVTSPAIVVERVGAIDAFSRSWELVRDHFWPVLGALVLGLLIVFGISLVAGAIGVALGLVGVLILVTLGSILAAPVLALISAIIFFDLGGGQVAAAPAAPVATPPPPAAPTA